MKKIFFISGKVIRGKDRGKQLGYPTANIRLSKTCQIKSGVYAVRVWMEDEVLDGAAFIRPQSHILEIYIFDFEKDLYGKELKVGFLKRLREARKFKTDRELKAQIKKDCQSAKQFLKRNVYRNN